MGGVDKGVGGGRGAVREVDSVNANETKQQTSGQFNAYLHLTAAGEEKKLESSVGLGYETSKLMSR